MAGLLSLATAVPPHELRTPDVIREATAIFAGRHSDFERLMPVFGNSGIERRYSVMPYEWFRDEQGWPERTAAFIAGASTLFAKVASLALAKAGLKAADIDTIVMVILDRRCHALDRGAHAERDWASAPMCSACRCSGWAVPAASPACRWRRGLPGPRPAPTCCWW